MRNRAAVLLLSLALLGVLAVSENTFSRRGRVPEMRVSEVEESRLIDLLNEVAPGFDEQLDDRHHHMINNARAHLFELELIDDDEDSAGDERAELESRSYHDLTDLTSDDDEDVRAVMRMGEQPAPAVAIPPWMRSAPNLVSLVLRDHTVIRQLAGQYRNDSGAEKVVAARRLMASLMLHDRRERTLLYPLAVRVIGDKAAVEMRNEHDAMLLSLLPMVRGNLADEQTQAKLDSVMTRVLAHLDEEENDLLPNLRRAMQNSKQTNARLGMLWVRLRYTGAPLVTELVRAEHAMSFSMVRSFLLALDSDEPNKAAGLAKRMLVYSAQHRRCEGDAYYPLIATLAGEGMVRALVADHDKMTKFETLLRTESMSVKNFNNLVLKLLRLKIAHVAKENSMLLPVTIYLINHHDENEALVTKYLRCEMARAE